MKADEKVCPRCAETIKAAALVCRFCGHEFAKAEQESPPALETASMPSPDAAAVASDADVESPKSPTATKWLLGCGGLFVFVLLLGMCATPNPKDGSNDSEAENATGRLPAEDATGRLAAEDATGTTEADAKSKWTYNQVTDQVRNKTVYYAEIDSSNSVDFSFPYSGGSTLRLTVRQHPQWGTDVITQISDGQFVCGVYNCSGMINFGSGPEKISLNTPEDHDSQTLFIRGSSGVIAKLKKADKVIIELPFYQEGNRQFTFETKGLEWPPGDKSEK